MSAGTKTINKIVNNAGTPTSYRTGTYYTRTWTGTDYPSAKPSYTNVFVRTEPPKYRWVHDVNPDGSKGAKRRILLRPGFDVYRKRWVKPVARARKVEHAYSTSGYRQSCNTFFRVTNGAVSGQDPFSLMPVYADPWSSNDDLAMLGKLREKVAGSDFNAGVFLGEGHQALSMITDSATRIYKAYKSARRGDFRKAAKALTHNYTRRPVKAPKVGASNWLELQYGWLPLLQDVEAGAQFLAHQFSSPLQFKVLVQRCAGGTHPKQVVRLAKANAGITVGTQTIFLSNVQIIRQKQIRAILSEKDVVALSGLMDPLSIAWELMPYSFILDWFVPVGNFLAARGLEQALTGQYITTSMFKAIWDGPAGLPAGVFSFYQGQAAKDLHGEKWAFTRTVSTNLSIPYPSVKPLGKILGWKHAANAVALLINHKTSNSAHPEPIKWFS